MNLFEIHLNNNQCLDGIALKFQEQEVTYAELERNVEGYARYLSQLGLKAGERAAIALSNCPEFIYSYLGILRAGGIAVPLNLLQTPRELAFMIHDSGSSFLLSNKLIGRAFSQLPEQTFTTVTLDEACREAISAAQPVDFPKVDSSDVCTFLYTTGTTGKPKAVMLTHNNLIANVIAMDEISGFGAADNFLALLPMFHSFGWATSVLLPLYLGCTITILDNFRPKEILQVLFEKGVTVFCGVPSMFSVLIKLRSQVSFPRLRYAFSGGDSISAENLIEFENKFNTPIIEGYGLSEASPLVSLNPINGVRKIKSVGVPLPGVEVKVVNDEGSEQPAGEIGELITRGPNIMKGYYNREEETRSALRDNWLYTGDLAYKDKDSYIFIVGRKKELIITSGFNVYPREIEETLEEHPAVKEAAVIGIPHPVKGQDIKAYIILEEGCSADKQELFHFLRDRLALYKIPEVYEFRNELPRAANGKILKRLLD
ncbi:long-chain-fatty-acid--CoA ligase [Pelotomaculum propionicicum]|uniref:Long-chain-fatty-acid--CoA ligase n=1 Tax=Pelotomaculum propionicicum TaxID=258475 RepID=A0A4Y7RUQ5_9FIRM|nr:long-chain fatty acid--CoA ligase [Pelotomaculum propionicicum]TEB12486.1 Long-chain-fatty-acid--CoA ligase [Pelotomaculum propionicicum]